MEDKCNTGGTRHLDAEGNEITEEEYLELIKQGIGDRVEGIGNPEP
jgi:hypothetical protein